MKNRVSGGTAPDSVSMPPFHVETVVSVLRDMLPTLVTVTIQPLMGSTAIEVNSCSIQSSKIIGFQISNTTMIFFVCLFLRHRSTL